MKVSVSASALEEAVGRARHATSDRITEWAYAGVFLEGAGSRLSVTGSDGENAIIGYAPALVEEEGSTLLLAKPLLEWLRTIERGEIVTLESGDDDLTAGIDGATAYHFRTIATGYVKPEGARSTPTGVDLRDLPLALAAVRSSVGSSGVVQLVSDEENLHLNTTDTYRVGSALLHDAGWGVFSGLVPLSVLERVADSEIHEVAVDVKGRVIEFSGAKVRFIVRLSASQFPRVEATLSLVPVHSIQVSLSLLRVALARLGALVESNALQCTIADGELRLSVRSALGDGVEILEVTGEDSTEFAVMLDYLRTSLIGREGDLVTLRWTNATSPLFITSSDPLAITTIVMPVRM